MANRETSPIENPDYFSRQTYLLALNAGVTAITHDYDELAGLSEYIAEQSDRFQPQLDRSLFVYRFACPDYYGTTMELPFGQSPSTTPYMPASVLPDWADFARVDKQAIEARGLEVHEVVVRDHLYQPYHNSSYLPLIEAFAESLIREMSVPADRTTEDRQLLVDEITSKFAGAAVLQWNPASLLEEHRHPQSSESYSKQIAGILANA